MASERKGTRRIKRASKVFGVNNAVDVFSDGNAQCCCTLFAGLDTDKAESHWFIQAVAWFVGLTKHVVGICLHVRESQTGCEPLISSLCSAVVEAGVPCVRADRWKWEQFSLAVKHVRVLETKGLYTTDAKWINNAKFDVKCSHQPRHKFATDTMGKQIYEKVLTLHSIW